MISARTDERIQPALHALLLSDIDGLRAALEVDPEVVNLTVGGNTLLELTTQPDASPPTSEIVGVLVEAGAPVDYLLDTGVDIDARPYRNTTALHFAIQFRRHGMVRLLLDRGAIVTIEDDTYQSDAAGWAQACDNGRGCSDRLIPTRSSTTCTSGASASVEV